MPVQDRDRRFAPPTGGRGTVPTSRTAPEGAEHRVLTRRKVLEAGAITAIATLAPNLVCARPREKPDSRTADSHPAAPANADANRALAPIRQLLGQARSWSYQLQGYDMRQLSASTADILVLDDTVGADSQGRRTTAPVRQLQVKPDGGRRIVLAYLSIGEAEEYRHYWKPEWIETAEPDPAEPDPAGASAPASAAPPNASPQPTARDATSAVPPVKPVRKDRWPSAKAPAWLGDENEAWSGNFAVRFEDPDWQAIFLEGPQSYLARIVASGFDGVYLDRVDAFYDHNGDLADPAAAMVSFVARIARTARELRPGFLIVPQNGEELLLRKGYVDLIDAIAKEDLLYGSPTEATPNSNAQIVNSVGWLGIARRKGRPVLVVEYLDDPRKVTQARLELTRLGYIPTFAPRMLDALSPFAVPPPGAAHQAR